MISNKIKEKGILAKLLEQGIKILLIKECKKISNVKIDILASSIEIIKGELQKINIIAEDINYKDLSFDEIELEANQIKINFELKSKKIYFKKNPIVKFKISVSENSLKTVLLSNNWACIGNMISKELLNQERLEDIKISNGKLLMETSNKEITNNQLEKINIKTEKGKLCLENKTFNKTIYIPLEDKIYIKNVNIENNLINIFANSSLSF
tara:strand:+ start:55 stop:687 length:633 start_codon:yes stop_codon:yes gene_type:complete